MPPNSTPAAAPLPPIAPQIPSALFRSAPSSKVVMMIASVAGEMIAAPSPCTARAAISTPIEPASPQASDATENSATPDHEHAPPPEQVGGAAAEQQEAAERDRVGDQHPLQALVRDVRATS